MVQDEQGVALVLALMAMVVLSILTAGLLTVVAVNHRTTLRSTEARKAFGIAETGLAYAEGNVYGAAAAHSTPAAGQTHFSQDGEQASTGLPSPATDTPGSCTARGSTAARPAG